MLPIKSFFGSYVFLCNADACQLFISTTYERYLARLGPERFARLAGFFLDERPPSSGCTVSTPGQPFILTPVLAGHLLIALGVLPGYRGVWRSMHFSGRIPIETAWRVWPGWTERALTREVPSVESATPAASAQPSERLH